MAIEIGTGGMSSEILQKALRRSPNLRVFSFENDSLWADKYLNDYPNQTHFELLRFTSADSLATHLEELISNLRDGKVSLAFIDSSPWESREVAVRALAHVAETVLVHDVDYFPRNRIFGQELVAPRFPNKMRLVHRPRAGELGLRSYSDVFSAWVELFPRRFASVYGPPTLLGSNLLSLEDLPIPPNMFVRSTSEDFHH